MKKISRYHRLVNVVVTKDIKAPLKPSTFTLVRGIMEYSHNILKVRGIVARFLRATVPAIRARESIPGALGVEDYELADKVMKLCSMMETAQLMKTNSLAGLSPFVLGGLLCTRGRLGKAGMMMKLGHSEMVILSPKSALARLIMIEAHAQVSPALFYLYSMVI